jgi:hypothetical protein
VPASNIAASLRNPTSWPAIEVAVTAQTRDPFGHQVTTLEIVVHSTSGAAECWAIIEKVLPVMTAKSLTDIDSGFKVNRCRQTNCFREPRNEWATSQVVEFDLHVAELEPVHQSQ